MPQACCAHPPSFTIERRRSDFERDARVTPFTGSCCCCCCCLHWIGGVAGGVVGMRMGWKAGERALADPLPPEARKSLSWGISLGVVLTVVLTAAAIVVAVLGASENVGSWVLLAVALAPPLGFIPIAAPAVFAAYTTRRRMFAGFRHALEQGRSATRALTHAEGSLYRAPMTIASVTPTELAPFSLFCRHCWVNLDTSSHLAACPDCGKEIDKLAIKGPDFGVGVAWRGLLYGVGISTACTIASYLLMWLIAIVIAQ